MKEKEIILKQIEILQGKQENSELLVDELIRLSSQICSLLSMLEKYSTVDGSN